MSEGIDDNRVTFGLTTGTGKTGEADWSIGTPRLYKTSEGDNWSTAAFGVIVFAIKGTLGGYATDATLSDLALEGATDGELIALNTTFDADTITYTASVANRIEAVNLTATKNDTNATVAITSDDNTGTPD